MHFMDYDPIFKEYLILIEMPFIIGKIILWNKLNFFVKLDWFRGLC